MAGRITLRITNEYWYCTHIFAKVMDATDGDIQFYHCITMLAKRMAMRMSAAIHLCKITCTVSVQRGCTLYNCVMALQQLENLL